MEYDDEADDFPELSTACALTHHEDCWWGKCACDCHNEENAAMVEALRLSRASTQAAPAASTCRSCKKVFANPYSKGESYLCDDCLTAPVDDAAILRIRTKA